jgi:hypothetical protein
MQFVQNLAFFGLANVIDETFLGIFDNRHHFRDMTPGKRRARDAFAIWIGPNGPLWCATRDSVSDGRHEPKNMKLPPGRPSKPSADHPVLPPVDDPFAGVDLPMEEDDQDGYPEGIWGQ